MRTILVTGAGGNASRNFVRSLRLSNGDYRFVGIDKNKYHLETADLDARYILPSCDEKGYLDKLRMVIDAERVDFVHPQPDVEVEFISEHRDKMPMLFLPSHSAIVLCHNKIHTNKTLYRAGVPVPHSLLVERVEDIPDLMGDLQKDDGMVWLRAVRGAGSRAALPVRTKRQAEEWIHYWRANRQLESKDFMLAQYLPGREFAFQSVWHKGKLITSMARERMEYMFGNLMPSGQSSSPSIAKTVHNDAVNMIASKAIRAVDVQPHGVYCVDLKENDEGVPCVTEINIGRFFTTSDFFAEAGSNMPYIYTRLGFGESVKSLPEYNAIPKDLYWIRGVDREPTLIRGESWTSTKL